MGHGQMLDHMFLDGLEDAYEGGLMGSFAQATAGEPADIDVDDPQHLRMDAKKAVEDGTFAPEIKAVTVSTRRGDKIVSTDEQPFNANIDKIPTLRAAFRKGGTVTAANSSSISDGAAALVLMRRSEAEKRGHDPLAIIHAHATHSQEPSLFTTAPIGSIEKALAKTGWSVGDVDLFEINEAFCGCCHGEVQSATWEIPRR